LSRGGGRGIFAKWFWTKEIKSRGGLHNRALRLGILNLRSRKRRAACGPLSFFAAACRAGLRVQSKPCMDMTWVTDRIALGGGIWYEYNMLEVVRSGVTHIIDMQIEFDDTPLAEPYQIKVLWLAVDDDFLPKPPSLLQRGVDFAQQALD